MARLLSEQGHWQRAAEICRHLLQTQPGREDVAEALAEAERRAQERSPRTAAELVPLFQQHIKEGILHFTGHHITLYRPH